MKELIIFNLDDTLLNIVADLAHSMNHTLQVLGYPAHGAVSYSFMTGNGINKLFKRALPEGEKMEEDVFRVRKEFLLYYDRHNANESRPYPGIPGLLEALQDKGHKSAVASNKYQAVTEKLIAHYFPGIRFVAVFGRCGGVEVKPDPTMVYGVLQTADVSKEEVLYIGDPGIDMQTAISNGAISCGITWGFRPRTELGSFCSDFIMGKTETVLSIV